MIYPKRLVFEGIDKRVETLRLVNPGKDSTTYRISYLEARMKEDGKMETISEPDPGQNFAKPFLRFYPRQITIAPNQSQLIKVQLINIHRLRPGEYRSHLYVRAVQKQEVLKPEAEERPADSEVQIALKPTFGYAIPNIIQIGDRKTEVRLADFCLSEEDGNKNLQFVILRNGNLSVYGDIVVIHNSPNGNQTQIGTVRGVAVYAPGQIRKFTMRLYPPEDLDLSSGYLSIKYKGQRPGDPIFAEARFQP